MKPISRREWLQGSLLTGAVLGLPVLQTAAGAAFARPGAEPADDDDGAAALTRSALLRELNTSFVAWRGFGRPVGLRLVGVGDPATAVAAGTVGSENCFSALFEGAPYAPLGQGTYTLSHPVLGRLHLFLVPVGRPGRVNTYELAVNRIAA